MDAEMKFVDIVGYQNVVSSGSKFTVYLLQLKISDELYIVKHRYHDFKELHDQLTLEGLKLPTLPPKRFLGSLNPDFIVKRQEDLSQWLHQVIDGSVSSDPNRNQTLKDFLILTKEKIDLDTLNEMRGGHKSETSSIFGFGKPEEKKAVTAAEDINGGDNDEVGLLYNTPKMSLDAFELLKVIGKGSYGKVTLVKKKDTGQLYAMKTLMKTTIKRRNQVEHTKTERSVLGRAHHPFIVQLHYAFQTKQKLYFVLDYCSGGELFFHLSRMEKFPEHWSRFYAAEITMALGHLHDLGIVYRDLKPENILLDSEGHVLLADFGLAKEGVTEGIEGATSMCGTPEYLPPEILDRAGHGTSVDWWAMGMVLYEMLTGLPPWYTRNRQKLFDRVRNAPLTFPSYISEDAMSLISGLLQRNPADRLGTKSDKEIKSHPFFADVNWKDLYDRKIKPPFNPCKNIDGDDETTNFEAEFTGMQVSVGETSNMGSLRESDVRGSLTFQGFTYQKPSEMSCGLGTSSKTE